MPERTTPPGRVGEALALARSDREAARKAVAALSPDEQLALLCETPVSARREVLALLAEPERVIPRLPEAELVFTVKALGLDEASWLLDLATPEQLVACLDLDAWRGNELDRASLESWLAALAECGDEALLRHLRALDAELTVVYLKDRAEVVLRPPESEDQGWEPPPGARSLDGQFHLVAHRDGDDLAPLLRVLHLLFQQDYWAYFRLMQGAIWELASESEEWALRWRSGRLEDLGFPPWDEAMGIYRFVRPAERDALPDERAALDTEAWRLPVWMPSLPTGRDARHLVFRAIGELAEDERRAAFFAFVSLANQVAVADRMDLADAESTPRAIEKAAVWTSRGIAHVAERNAVAPAEVLRRVTLQRLFRVGASLEPAAARPAFASDAEPADAEGGA